mmetsp:Transcript_20469/g.41168  ORF Transcript_20469/g.41168 Transcript_20469/m.41168 type:complete len:269 (-) Transcript_20469:719-1525(-)
MGGISSAGGMLAVISATAVAVAVGVIARVAAPSAGDGAFAIPSFFPLPPIAVEDGGAEDDGEEHGSEGGYGGDGPDVVHGSFVVAFGVGRVGLSIDGGVVVIAIVDVAIASRCEQVSPATATATTIADIATNSILTRLHLLRSQEKQPLQLGMILSEQLLQKVLAQAGNGECLESHLFQFGSGGNSGWIVVVAVVVVVVGTAGGKGDHPPDEGLSNVNATLLWRILFLVVVVVVLGGGDDGEQDLRRVGHVVKGIRIDRGKMTFREGL